ncbi:hypothetical protein B0H19DRAFT_1074249 [Mycena capillaripes]|nr:hypothetical protein B0H19DRAFT_1074249 [Mycena capillaripes]
MIDNGLRGLGRRLSHAFGLSVSPLSEPSPGPSPNATPDPSPQESPKQGSPVKRVIKAFGHVFHLSSGPDTRGRNGRNGDAPEPGILSPITRRIPILPSFTLRVSVDWSKSVSLGGTSPSRAHTAAEEAQKDGADGPGDEVRQQNAENENVEKEEPAEKQEQAENVEKEDEVEEKDMAEEGDAQHSEDENDLRYGEAANFEDEQELDENGSGPGIIPACLSNNIDTNALTVEANNYSRSRRFPHSSHSRVSTSPRHYYPGHPARSSPQSSHTSRSRSACPEIRLEAHPFEDCEADNSENTRLKSPSPSACPTRASPTSSGSPRSNPRSRERTRLKSLSPSAHPKRALPTSSGSLHSNSRSPTQAFAVWELRERAAAQELRERAAAQELCERAAAAAEKRSATAEAKEAATLEAQAQAGEEEKGNAEQNKKDAEVTRAKRVAAAEARAVSDAPRLAAECAAEAEREQLRKEKRAREKKEKEAAKAEAVSIYVYKTCLRFAPAEKRSCGIAQHY